MPSWAWWLIWGGLGFFSMLYLGYLGYNLFGKASRALSALEPTAKRLEILAQAASQPPKIDAFEGNLLDEVGPLQTAHSRNLKKREARRVDRQRRLINKLIDYQADESEFKP